MSNSLMLVAVAVFFMVMFYNAYTFWLISHISRIYPSLRKELNLPTSYFDFFPNKAFNLFRFLWLSARVEIDASLKRLVLAWRFMFLFAALGFMVVIAMAISFIRSQQI